MRHATGKCAATSFFFGAPTVTFIFVHAGLRGCAVLDAGIYLQTRLLAARSHGLATLAQGALATWDGPVRAEFVIPRHYKLICGVSIGYASDHPVNQYNPGRRAAQGLLIPPLAAGQALQSGANL